MRWILGIALLLTTSCRDPKPHATAATAAPSAPPPAPSASVAVALPEASAAEPKPSASERAATPRCPDAGTPKDRPIGFVYTQVFVPSPGEPRGTRFSGTFRGRAIPIPPAREIYPWCSVETTDDPTTFKLTCEKRKEPVCTVRVGEASVEFECGGARHNVDVPCGERATLRPGRIPGSVSYN